MFLQGIPFRTLELLSPDMQIIQYLITGLHATTLTQKCGILKQLLSLLFAFQDIICIMQQVHKINYSNLLLERIEKKS